jgi:AcrR family transcriptional regulator
MPPARQSRHAVLTAFRRTALLDAARRVFGAHGFEQATMEGIAREAGVAKGTVYLYYRSKRAIYEAAFNDCMAQLDQLTRRHVEEAGTLQAAIAGFVAARVQFFQEHPEFFQMYVAELGSQVGATRQRRRVARSMLDRQMHLLEDAIVRAASRGEIRPVEPAPTALAIFDMTRGLVARHLLSRGTLDVSRDVTFLTELIWTGLHPAAQARRRGGGMAPGAQTASGARATKARRTKESASPREGRGRQNR